MCGRESGQSGDIPTSCQKKGRGGRCGGGGGGLADAAEVLVLLLKPVRMAGGAVGAEALSRGNCRLKD